MKKYTFLALFVLSGCTALPSQTISTASSITPSTSSTIATIEPSNSPTFTPWVKAYERAYLADPIMRFEQDPVSSNYMRHVYQAREGAQGAEGGSGGGCGCN